MLLSSASWRMPAALHREPYPLRLEGASGPRGPLVWEGGEVIGKAVGECVDNALVNGAHPAHLRTV